MTNDNSTSKSIALFFDGTWLDGQKNTYKSNVWKLFDSLDKSVINKHYIPGVGADSMSKGSCLIEQLISKIPNWAGGLSGYGISEKIQEGYEFLLNNYKKGDKIYLFGFSRGAYAARSLSGFVDLVGLYLKDAIDKNQKDAITMAFEIYEEKNSETRKKRLETFRNQFPDFVKYLESNIFDNLKPTRDKNHEISGKEINEIKENLLPIYFVGVWDTVCSLGIPDPYHNMLYSKVSFHNTELSRHVTHARQALSLHDIRFNSFEPVLWTRMPHRKDFTWRPYTNDEEQSVSQMWFPGIHSDVGGSYQQSGLSNIALYWMAENANDANLAVNLDGIKKLIIQNNAFSKIHIEKIPAKFLVEPLNYIIFQSNDNFDSNFDYFDHPSVRSAINHDYLKTLADKFNEKEEKEFWSTIHFHQTSVKWILDHLIGDIKYTDNVFYDYDMTENDLSTAIDVYARVDRSAFDLIEWRINNILDSENETSILKLFRESLIVWSITRRFDNWILSTDSYNQRLKALLEKIVVKNKSFIIQIRKFVPAFADVSYMVLNSENTKISKLRTEIIEILNSDQALKDDFFKFVKNLLPDIDDIDKDPELSLVIDDEWIIVNGYKLLINNS